MTILPRLFLGIEGRKLAKFFRQIFVTFFAHVGERVRQNFALEAFRGKKSPDCNRAISIAERQRNRKQIDSKSVGSKRRNHS